jgi:hypothetical protein
VIILQIGQVLGTVSTPEFAPRKRFAAKPAEQPQPVPEPVAEAPEQPVLVTA